MGLTILFCATIGAIFYYGRFNENQLCSKYIDDIEKHTKAISTGSNTLLNLANIKAKNGLTILTSLPEFIQQAPPASKFRYLTTVLTSVGVFGTFLGIVIGLKDVATKTAGDLSATFGAVTSLLGGMEVAFISSMAGMACSIGLLWLINKNDRKKQDAYKILTDLFFKSFRLETIGDYLSNLSPDGQNELLEKQLEIAEKSSKASDALLEMGQAMTKSAANFDANKIGEHISTALDNIFRTEMVPVFKDISKELTELREIKQDNGEKIIEVIKTEIIIPLTDEIINTNKMVARSAESLDRLNEEFGGITLKLAEAVSTIQTFQQDTMQQLQNFAGQLKDILSSFQEDTKGVLEGVSQSITSAVEQSIQGLTEQREHFKSNAEDAAKTFRDIRTELEKALEMQATVQNKLLEDTTARYTAIMEKSQEAFDSQSNVLNDVGQNAVKVMDSSRENMEKTLGNIEGSLLATKDLVETELETFRQNYQTALQQFFTEQNNLLEKTLGSQRDGLASVVLECKEVFVEEYSRRKELGEALSTNLDDIGHINDVISTLLASVKSIDASYINTIEQAANAINRQSASMEKQLLLTQQHMKDFIDEVPEALNSYFESANKSHIKFFEGMDDAATQIHQRLLQSAEYLVTAQVSQKELQLDDEI
ncbi:hypothetical protein [Candidatus Njordibacter sp. Uisw_058]|uniref:hypothetical protein n=1 Tax=Candidatus Njordibacter sp. Uisw_058 TaxID=3230974 RepID=UPI003D3A1510